MYLGILRCKPGQKVIPVGIPKIILPQNEIKGAHHLDVFAVLHNGLPGFQVSNRKLELNGFLRIQAEIPGKYRRFDVKLRDLLAQGEFLFIGLGKSWDFRLDQHIPFPLLTGSGEIDDGIHCIVEGRIDGIHNFICNFRYLLLTLVGIGNFRQNRTAGHCENNGDSRDGGDNQYQYADQQPFFLVANRIDGDDGVRSWCFFQLGWRSLDNGALFLKKRRPWSENSCSGAEKGDSDWETCSGASVCTGVGGDTGAPHFTQKAFPAFRGAPHLMQNF